MRDIRRGPLTRFIAPLLTGSLAVAALALAAPSGASAGTTPAPSTVSIEDSDAGVTYTSGWRRTPDLFSSGGSDTVTSTGGATASYRFEGTSITWYGTASFIGGRAEVLVDGVSRGTVDLYSLFPQFGAALWSSGTLPTGIHQLTIRATGTHNFFAWGTAVNVDRLRYTLAPLPTLGFAFDATQQPVAAKGLTGLVSCSRPLTVAVSYTVTQGSVTRTGTAAVACSGPAAVTVPIDVTGLVSGPATITWKSSWKGLVQQVTNPQQTASVNLSVGAVIGLGLDASGFRGDGTTFVGGTLTCDRAVDVDITGTLPGGQQTSQRITCPASGAVTFLLQWNVASDAGTVSITATGVTSDGASSVTVTSPVVIA